MMVLMYHWYDIIIFINRRFMAKSAEKLKARFLRKQGKSIRAITKLLGVSKGSVSLWCRDVPLSKKQITRLHENKVRGGYPGRMKGALLQKIRKQRKIEEYRLQGIQRAERIDEMSLLFIGLGLFLGEGSKAQSRVRFSNSDPKIILLAMNWFMSCFDVYFEDFEFRIYINDLHRFREKEILRCWRFLTGAPATQFRKSVFIKSVHKKVYENAKLYIGTASLIVKKSSDLQYRILGLCYGILERFGRGLEKTPR